MKDRRLKGGQSQRKNCCLHFWSLQLVRLTSCQHGQLPARGTQTHTLQSFPGHLPPPASSQYHGFDFTFKIQTEACYRQCVRVQMSALHLHCNIWCVWAAQTAEIRSHGGEEELKWAGAKVSGITHSQADTLSMEVIRIRKVLFVGICLFVYSTLTC